tara:strand:- start:56 stop:493 length:438 start_codon:yes stop_codon:yes gene_type:complete
MSLLTLINNIPLYSTIEEANIWGSQYNMTGYHTHIHNSITGYMPGETHEEIITQVSQGIQNFLTPQQLATGQFVVTIEAVQAYYQNQAENAAIAPQPQQQIQPTIPQQNIVQDQEEEDVFAQNLPPALPGRAPTVGGGGGYSGGY